MQSFSKTSRKEFAFPKKRKWINTAAYEEVDSAMYKWLKNARHSILPINSNLFKMKGLDFAKLLAFDDYQASDGWLGRLRKCFNVSFKTVSGKYTFAMSLEFAPSILSHLLDWKLYQRIPTSKRYCQRLVKIKNALGKSPVVVVVVVFLTDVICNSFCLTIFVVL